MRKCFITIFKWIIYGWFTLPEGFTIVYRQYRRPEDTGFTRETWNGRREIPTKVGTGCERVVLFPGLAWIGNRESWIVNGTRNRKTWNGKREKIPEYSDLFTNLSRQNLLPLTDKTRASKLGSPLPFHVCRFTIAGAWDMDFIAFCRLVYCNLQQGNAARLK